MRALTILFYLNDVEEGGETFFPRVNITVSPKKGSLALFASVSDDDVHSCNQDSLHSGLPVKKGVKYAANFWVHPANFEAYGRHTDDGRGGNHCFKGGVEGDDRPRVPKGTDDDDDDDDDGDDGDHEGDKGGDGNEKGDRDGL